jgi:IclR family pca regulon transcriptional regulator
MNAPSVQEVDPDPTRANLADREIMGGFLKGLSVIEAFDRDHDALTIADVAKLTGLDRATARRCLLTLVKLGYAEADGKRFQLTARVLRLGYAYLSATSLPRLIQPYLERLSETTGESCSASVLDGGEIVYVARASQRRVLSIGLSVGSRLPAYCTSMGRVLLSALAPAEARRVLDRSAVRKLTPSTVTSVEKLMAILDEVRRGDFALIDQELELGLRSIAVPLRNERGKVLAAINVGLQAARMTPAEMQQVVLPKLRVLQAELVQLLP